MYADESSPNCDFSARERSTSSPPSPKTIKACKFGDVAQSLHKTVVVVLVMDVVVVVAVMLVVVADTVVVVDVTVVVVDETVVVVVIILTNPATTTESSFKVPIELSGTPGRLITTLKERERRTLSTMPPPPPPPLLLMLLVGSCPKEFATCFATCSCRSL